MTGNEASNKRLSENISARKKTYVELRLFTQRAANW
jgi:hypothetical protein